MYLVKFSDCTDHHVDSNVVLNGAGELQPTAA
jgi:hypothetical protein